MLRANIYIRAFDADGEAQEFTCYHYNADGIKNKDFKKQVKNDKLDIAERYCADTGFDFSQVLSLDFEDVEDDDYF